MGSEMCIRDRARALGLKSIDDLVNADSQGLAKAETDKGEVENKLNNVKD